METADENINETEHRLSAIEQRLTGIEAQLNDIRKIVASGDHEQGAVNEQTRQQLATIAEQVEELKDHAYPAFFKVFPKQGEFLDEVDRVLASHRKK
jgi:septal ring factor EnvC (AmiA/AmiB activator)